MDLTIFVLLAANILVPAIVTYKSCVSHGLEVNHVAIFTFGYLFYWILPIARGRFISCWLTIPAETILRSL